ncbi:liprin-beta-1 isoform X2 [Genypterus blacodes]
MMSDASDMLAAALEQMDGIIAGSKAMDYSNGLFDCQSPTTPFLGGLRVLHLLEDLRAALELMDNEERDNLRCQIPDSTAEGLAEWLHGRMTNGHGSVGADATYQERLSRLESDKECLILQVSVLTDQVEVQGEKIRDLDNCLERHREELKAADELLQQELLTRTSLENQKLELMAEVSSLKLKLNSVEREHRDSQGLYQEVTELRFRVTDVENERLQCEQRLQTARDELELLQRQLEDREVELRRMKDREDGDEGAERDVEMSRMKRLLESLALANDAKERRIRELEELLTNCSNMQEQVKETSKDDDYDDIPDDPTLPAPPEAEQRVTLALEGVAGRSSGESIPCIAVLSEMKELDRERQLQSAESSPDVPHAGALTVTSCSEQTKTKAASGSTKASATSDDSFGTKKARSSFGRGFFKLRRGKQTASIPNLAETERKGTEHLDLAGVPQRKPQKESHLPSTPEAKKKPKGFMRFFGRLKRSHSTSFNLDDAAEVEFRRGGVRATAGPRLGWSRDLKHGVNGVDVPFSRWSNDDVCAWLHDQGLGLYVGHGQSWIKSGQTLLQASQHDLEKELGIKQPLHRKKLLLALQALGSDEDDLRGKLDHNWVTRWLDDIGLPQYKSHFEEARVDGRVLHFLTVEDLLSLKVGSVLHHLSIKRAIQVLRLSSYEPTCLRRRPSVENNATPAEIAQWTSHRVMEWLRSVDLAEYAPNLRGSGVHGGLMVLEPRFNVETLALLLNIPPNKTLLRRHLATHFHLLVGSEAQRLKQDCLENPDYAVLTATARVKPRRLSFGGFGSLRKKRHEDTEEYICPMNVEMPQNSSFQRSGRIYEEPLEHLEQMEASEGAVRQIGAFSEGINNLTSMLKDEQFFREISVRPADVRAAQADDDSSV